jgi:tetratricopeptide (TPR) repeat protein
LVIIGQVYETQGNLLRANEIFIQSLKLNHELGNKRDIAATLTFIGHNLALQNDFEKAMEYYRESNQIASETGLLPELAENARNISLTFAAIHQMDSAEFYLDQYIRLQDSLNIDAGELLALKQSSETDKASSEQSGSDTNSNVLFILNSASMILVAGLVAFIFALITLLIMMHRKLRKKQPR